VSRARQAAARGCREHARESRAMQKMLWYRVGHGLGAAVLSEWNVCLEMHGSLSCAVHAGCVVLRADIVQIPDNRRSSDSVAPVVLHGCHSRRASDGQDVEAAAWGVFGAAALVARKGTVRCTNELASCMNHRRSPLFSANEVGACGLRRDGRWLHGGGCRHGPHTLGGLAQT